MPTSAAAREGASFIPSPTIATLPLAVSSRIAAALPSGKSSERTSRIPADSATARAHLSLSPVSMTTLTPIFESSSIADGASSRILSEIAIRPKSTPPRAMKITVFPSAESLEYSLSASFESSLCPFANPWLTASISSPEAIQRTPAPGVAEKPSEGKSSAPLFCARAHTARAIGCSLFASAVYAAEISSSFVALKQTTSETCGSPTVTVPVLSMAKVFVRPRFSRACADLKSIPRRAAMPEPTVIATGVASPSAQGQLITSTEMHLPRA